MTDDTISRQAAKDYIDSQKGRPFIGCTIGEAMKIMLDEVPPAQPEIIHCKDCKYNPNPPECGNAACVLFYGMTDQMGFCHHGERRERE